MKIYVGQNKKKAKAISFESLLYQTIRNNGFNVDSGMFSDESASWVEIIQKDDKKQITINFLFDGDVIERINVYEAKMIIDEANAKKII